MNRYLQITFVAAAFLLLIWAHEHSGTNRTLTANPPLVSPTANASQTPTSSPATTGSSPSPSASSSAYVDGNYTGSPEDANYGTVQVKIGVSNGQITNVDFLQYPNDNPTSSYISSQAMPILKSEAIQAQSAQVSGVSGASFTSQAFQASLASAIQQAQRQG